MSTLIRVTYDGALLTSALRNHLTAAFALVACDDSTAEESLDDTHVIFAALDPQNYHIPFEEPGETGVRTLTQMTQDNILHERPMVMCLIEVFGDSADLPDAELEKLKTELKDAAQKFLKRKVGTPPVIEAPPVLVTAHAGRRAPLKVLR